MVRGHYVALQGQFFNQNMVPFLKIWFEGHSVALQGHYDAIRACEPACYILPRLHLPLVLEMFSPACPTSLLCWSWLESIWKLFVNMGSFSQKWRAGLVCRLALNFGASRANVAGLIQV